MKKLLLPFLLALAVACAAQPRLDTTTMETVISSQEKIANSLSEEKRQKFAGAMIRIMAADAQDAMQGIMAGAFKGMADAMSGKSPVPPTTISPNAGIGKRLKSAHGMTADEVIALGDQVLKEQQAK